MAITLDISASIGDPDGTRTVTSIVVLLAVLGIGLGMLAIWLFKVTRPDPDVLAPLDVMGDRKWRRADPVWQRRRLDQVRPPDAKPLQPSVAPPELDEAFDQGPAASGFDDLHDDAHVEAAPAVEGLVVDEPLAQEPPGDDHAEATAEPSDEASTGERMVSATAATPTGIPRPDDLSDRDLDPELIELAMRELEAELTERQQLVDGDDAR